MNLLIAIPVASAVILMAICAFAGQPVRDELNQIQAEEEAKK